MKVSTGWLVANEDNGNPGEGPLGRDASSAVPNIACTRCFPISTPLQPALSSGARVARVGRSGSAGRPRSRGQHVLARNLPEMLTMCEFWTPSVVQARGPARGRFTKPSARTTRAGRSWKTMRPHREPGIRADANGRIQGLRLSCRADCASGTLPPARRRRPFGGGGHPDRMRSTQGPAGTSAADWTDGAARVSHLRRDANTPADRRAALAELSRTHAPPRCAHCPRLEARGLSYDMVQGILAGW